MSLSLNRSAFLWSMDFICRHKHSILLEKIVRKSCRRLLLSSKFNQSFPSYMNQADVWKKTYAVSRETMNKVAETYETISG